MAKSEKKKSLAFFPWLNVPEDIKLCGIELKKYERGLLPFGKGTSGQNNCDKILSHYIDNTGNPVSSAVILKLATKRADAYLDEEERNFLFEAAQIITFAGLSAREFFGVGLTYWNADHFYLVIHQFTDDPEGVTIATRRRDGQTIRYYSFKTFSERVPPHVNIGTTCEIDVRLANALLNLREKESNEWISLWDAIFFFNRANTDSYEIPPQQEVVMILGVFQRLLEHLLEQRAREEELAKKFVSTIGSFGALPAEKKQRLLRYQREKVPTVREAWFRDFYRLRNALAHGKTQSNAPLAWTIEEHLLLASFIFPLFVKKVLRGWGVYRLTECDEICIEVFDELAIDPFGRIKSNNNIESWRWNKVIAHKNGKKLSRRLQRLLGKGWGKSGRGAPNH